MEMCRLCGNPNLDKPESHIVSKFFYEWLKNTSPTGFIREPINPNKRLQDGLKPEFLCLNCEKVFGKWEKRFSENIFKPLCDSNTAFSFECNHEYIMKFGISIVWRALEYFYGENLISDMTEGELIDIQKTLKSWKDYLLGHSQEIGKNNVYIIPVKQYANNNYKWRNYKRSISIDFKVFDDQYWGFVYVKVPYMIIVGDVIGSPDTKIKQYDIFKNNRIKDDINPSIPELVNRVVDKCISDFEEGIKNISQSQIEKIRETFIRKNSK